MVLVQLVVTNLTSDSLTANNNTYFNVPLYGVYDINVISLQFHDSGANTQFRVVELQSDILRFPHSSRQFLTFLNNAQTAINFEASAENMPSIKNIDLNGKILINTVLLAGTAFNNFHMVLTLEATVSNRAK
tara:strand:- start:120 stop:515 length:396 start_codon:yes stop_codon:yes gene_type:complete